MSDTEQNPAELWRALVCEAVGTFFLVLIGTGAIVVDQVSGGAIGHVGISLCFGIVVCVVIYSVGSISGAHINPAVSIGFFATGEIGLVKLVCYILSQLLGALVASLLVFFLFPEATGYGATLPNETIPGTNPVVLCLVFEFVLTFILMWVILAVTTPDHPNGSYAGLVIGLVIAMEALMGGPICGASMNPARSIAPAVVGGQLQHLWIYLLAPVAGALAASLVGPMVLGDRNVD